MNLEGELRVALTSAGARVARVDLGSTRPDVAARLLQGRTRAEALAALPRLFSLCSASQSIAGHLACAAAEGQEPEHATRAGWCEAIEAEWVRESAWRILLDAPRRLGEAVSEEAVAAARAAAAWRPGAASGRAIVGAVFGPGAATRDGEAFERWAAAGSGAAARLMRRLRETESGAAACSAPFLPAQPDAAWLHALAAAAEAEPAFARHPTWNGAPAETGALARLAADPLVAALLARSPARIAARFAARLVELARVLAGDARPAFGALALDAGAGIGWVQNARGLLVHRVRLDAGRVAAYRIVAPTEWNFHPAGVLAATLAGIETRGAVEFAELVVDSLDPCVACRVELAHG